LRGTNTPSEVAAACTATGVIIAAGLAAVCRATTKQPALGGLLGGLMQGRARRVRVSRTLGVSTPSTLCSLGLVVVYCSSTRFSGKTMGEAAKAASAASWKPDRMSFFLPG
jgi:hypothetical protein